MTVPDYDFPDPVPPSAGGHDDAARREECALVERVRDGDPDAFKRLVGIHIKGATRFACAVVGSLDAADDVVQAIFIQLWERRASLDPTRPLAPYLFRLVRNRALDERKTIGVRERHRHQVQADIAADAIPATVASPEGAVLNAATLEAVLQRLPERRRLALRLRFKDELTHAEIGEVLGISAEAAAMLLSRTVKELREILGR